MKAAGKISSLAMCLLLSGCYAAAWNPDRLDQWADRELPQSLMQHVPELESREEISILVFGDSGKPESFEKVVPWMGQACADRCDFALMLGDNFYLRGPSDPAPDRFRTHFKDPLSKHGAHLAGLNYWVVLGNHGYISLWGRPPSDPVLQLEYTYAQDPGDRPLWLMPAHQYAIPRLPAWLTVVGVDSFFGTDPDSFAGSAQEYEQARDAYVARVYDSLASKGDQGWRVMFGHHPKMTIGDHADENRIDDVPSPFEDLLPLIYFSGHDHDQQLIEAGGLVQVVQGAASKTRAKKWGVARAESYFDGTLAPAYERLGFATSAEYCEKLGFAIATFREYEFELTFYWGESGQPESSGQSSWSWSRQRNGEISRDQPVEPAMFVDICPDS